MRYRPTPFEVLLICLVLLGVAIDIALASSPELHNPVYGLYFFWSPGFALIYLASALWVVVWVTSDSLEALAR